MIKKIKYFLWKLFKSPERKWVGWSTLFTDFRSQLYSVFFMPKSKPITVCVGVKNRSNYLLQVLIHSLNQVHDKNNVALCVLDCGSNDVVDLHNEIKQKWDGNLIYHLHEQNFERSKVYNQLVNLSLNELVFICDADIQLPKDIVKKVNKYTNRFTSWFPILWWMNEDNVTGKFFSASTGMLATIKSNFIKTGGYDESIKEWGKEDWLLYFEFYKSRISCRRTFEKEMIHHYHPSLQPKDFKPLF